LSTVHFHFFFCFKDQTHSISSLSPFSNDWTCEGLSFVCPVFPSLSRTPEVVANLFPGRRLQFFCFSSFLRDYTDEEHVLNDTTTSTPYIYLPSSVSPLGREWGAFFPPSPPCVVVPGCVLPVHAEMFLLIPGLSCVPPPAMSCPLLR